ncbi:MAG: hypothetical protein H5U40_13040, partial [Polyangiaceae bacterium]|nr:hypothetical protein [Polyangiaceae bacterium]
MPRADEPQSPPLHEAAAIRVAALEAELAATADGRTKAFLHLEIGSLYERALDDAA